MMTKRLVATSLLTLLLGSAPLVAQHNKRPRPKAPPKPEPEERGGVDVKRSATLQVSIASDTSGTFNYLSDPQRLVKWFPDQAVLQPQLGGVYHFKWRDSEDVWSGYVIEFVRGNILGLSWKAPGDEVETSVRFKLSPQGSQTLVELTHSGFTSSDALEKAVTAWVFYLQNLKSVIEDGNDLRSELRQDASRPAPTHLPRKR